MLRCVVNSCNTWLLVFRMKDLLSVVYDVVYDELVDFFVDGVLCWFVCWVGSLGEEA